MSPFTAKPLLFSWVKSKSYDPKSVINLTTSPSSNYSSYNLLPFYYIFIIIYCFEKKKSPVYSSESTDTDPLITSLKQPRRFLGILSSFLPTPPTIQNIPPLHLKFSISSIQDYHLVLRSTLLSNNFLIKALTGA